MAKELCVITGVGPGTGTALVKKFAERYRVAMIARDQQRLQSLAAEVPGTMPFLCDVADEAANPIDAKVPSDCEEPGSKLGLLFVSRRRANDP